MFSGSIVCVRACFACLLCVFGCVCFAWLCCLVAWLLGGFFACLGWDAAIREPRLFHLQLGNVSPACLTNTVGNSALRAVGLADHFFFSRYSASGHVPRIVLIILLGMMTCTL